MTGPTPRIEGKDLGWFLGLRVGPFLPSCSGWKVRWDRGAIRRSQPEPVPLGALPMICGPGLVSLSSTRTVGLWTLLQSKANPYSLWLQWFEKKPGLEREALDSDPVTTSLCDFG